MLHTLKNDKLKVEIKTHGAELMSAVDLASGCEYVWQGDAKYWEDRAPVLFPVCSTFFEGQYTCKGKTYKMGIHGFAQHCDFETVSADDTTLVLRLTSSDFTREQYPFDFELILTYTLNDRELVSHAHIENNSGELMPVSFGAHPGFNTPLTKGAADFEDYYLEFSEPCAPRRMTFTPEVFMSYETIPLELEGGKIFRLKHSYFNPDGIFNSGTAREVTLKSDKDERSVTMKFHDMPYFGFWQEFGEDTPFICLEPWCAPPDNHGVPQDIFERAGMFKLEDGEIKEVSYSIIFN